MLTKAPSGPDLRVLAVLQRDGRLVDFLQEDIDPYSDAQIGAAGIGVELGSSVEIRILGTLQRYGFSFNPEPGDPKIAGGATDTYLSGGMYLAFRL